MENSGARAIQFRSAFYIKLGRNGQWEADSLGQGRLRLGWSNNLLADINAERWAVIEDQLRSQASHPGTATRDINALRDIALSTEEDVWITFNASRLWWCRLAQGPMGEDAVSKFRRTAGAWSDRDVGGRVLLTADIPGVLSQLQGFRGTVCRVKEAETLRRVLNAESSPAHEAVARARFALITEVRAALSQFHWKDFETLVDLLFRHAGWRRLSLLGEAMKFADLELEEPITGERYQVQIKSVANARDFTEYRDKFVDQGFRKLFFVVHSPTRDLTEELSTATVELVLPERLAEMVVDAGLVRWVLAKVR